MAETCNPLSVVVCLDAVYCTMPAWDAKVDYIEHSTTTNPALALERVLGADVVITTRVPITADMVEQCVPRLKLIAVMAAGTDIIDIAACRKHGVKVCNIPAASTESVGDHALSLYFAVKRKTVLMHNLTIKSDVWPIKRTAIYEFPSPPRVCSSETMGILGYGNLGRIIEKMAKALGMEVLIAERKGAPAHSTRPGRTAFEECLRRSTVVILSCPLNAETANLISKEELRMMTPSSILINVSRGGVVNEDWLCTALQEQWISGAATDVFAIEPATSESCVLLSDTVPNLTLSPHIAWFANSSLDNLRDAIKHNVESYLAGSPRNLVC